MIAAEIYMPILALVTALVITFLAIPSIIKVAHMKHLFDEPDERTVHLTKVPTLGGLAVFAGFSISSLLFTIDLPEIKYILAAVIILFFIGIKDDILVIAPLTKLLGQILATSIIVIFTDLQFTNLHGFFGITDIPQYIGIPLTIFTIIVVTNSFNLIDGIDGLAGGIGIIVAGTFGVWFYLAGYAQYTVIATALIGALLSFLRFNIVCKKNKIFMGDTGSLILGFIISVFVVKFNELNIKHNFEYAIYGAPAVSFAVLIIPLFDTMRVMFLRFFQKKPIFFPDKQHLHHLFLKLGLTHVQTDIILVVINLFFIIGVFSIHNLFGLRTIALFTILAAMIIFYVPVIILNRQKK